MRLAVTSYGWKVSPQTIPADHIVANIAVLKDRLEQYGLVNCLALYSWTDEDSPGHIADPSACLNLDWAVADADLLLELRYDTPLHVVKRFRRSAPGGFGPRCIADVG